MAKKEKYFTKKKEAYGGFGIYCECGGQVSVTAEGYQNIPLGLGFRQRKGGYGFGIDCQRRKLYKGFCIECRYSGTFQQRFKDMSKRIYTKRIRKVDQAIQRAQG